MKIGVLSSLFAVVFLSGCGFIQPREGVTPADIEKDIYAITRAATSVAIFKIHEDDVDEQIKIAGQIVASVNEIAMPIVSSPEAEVDADLATRLMTLMPEEYRGLMIAAYEVFNSHYTLPVASQYLQEPELGYLRAFLAAIRDGAKDILDRHGVVLDVTIEAKVPSQ